MKKVYIKYEDRRYDHFDVNVSLYPYVSQNADGGVILHTAKPILFDHIGSWVGDINSDLEMVSGNIMSDNPNYKTSLVNLINMRSAAYGYSIATKEPEVEPEVEYTHKCALCGSGCFKIGKTAMCVPPCFNRRL